MISGWIAEENLRVFCTWCAEQVGSSFSDDEWRAIEQAVLHDHEQCAWAFVRGAERVDCVFRQEAGASVVEIDVTATADIERASVIVMDLMAGYTLSDRGATNGTG